MPESPCYLTTAMKLRTTLFILSSAWLSIATAQDNQQDDQAVQIEVPEVALLDLESNNGTSITLSIEAPEEAGEPVNFDHAVDTSIWINYSSVIGSSTEPTRNVYAKITSGTVPSGLRLRVRASQDAGSGDGDLGVRTSWQNLNGNDKRVIRDIGTCYTGDGAGKGHQLTYELSLRNGSNRYAQIDFDDATTLTVLYTISND